MLAAPGIGASSLCPCQVRAHCAFSQGQDQSCLSRPPVPLGLGHHSPSWASARQRQPPTPIFLSGPHHSPHPHIPAGLTTCPCRSRVVVQARVLGTAVGSGLGGPGCSYSRVGPEPQAVLIPAGLCCPSAPLSGPGGTRDRQVEKVPRWRREAGGRGRGLSAGREPLSCQGSRHLHSSSPTHRRCPRDPGVQAGPRTSPLQRQRHSVGHREGKLEQLGLRDGWAPSCPSWKRPRGCTATVRL